MTLGTCCVIAGVIGNMLIQETSLIYNFSDLFILGGIVFMVKGH